MPVCLYDVLKILLTVYEAFAGVRRVWGITIHTACFSLFKASNDYTDPMMYNL